MKTLNEDVICIEKLLQFVFATLTQSKEVDHF